MAIRGHGSTKWAQKNRRLDAPPNGGEWIMEFLPKCPTNSGLGIYILKTQWEDDIDTYMKTIGMDHSCR